MFASLDTPYLTPTPDLLRAQDWSIEKGDALEPLESNVPNWTQGTDIYLTRSIEVDRSEILRAAGLPENAVIGIAVSWFSDSTKFRRSVYRAPIYDDPLYIRACLSGDEISSTIKIRTSLVLLTSHPEAPSWVANEPGAMLLKEEVPVSVEGDGSVFPMAVVDFASTTYPTNASWYLVTSTQLEARFSSTFQVMINERDTKLVKAIEATKPDREQTVLLENLEHGVVAALLELAYALRADDSLELEGHEDGSVGAVLAEFVDDSGDLALDADAGPSRIAYKRAFFESLARDIGAGRTIK